MKKEQTITVKFDKDSQLWGAQVDDGMTFAGDSPDEAFDNATEYLNNMEIVEAAQNNEKMEAVHQGQVDLLKTLANRAVAVGYYGLPDYVQRESPRVYRKPVLTFELVQGWLREQRFNL